MTGQPIPVIIDCDTGVDDALALLFAVRHPGLDVRAVTCVAGYTDVDGVVRNTLTVLEQAGAGDIPVARGAERPLIEVRDLARDFDVSRPWLNRVIEGSGQQILHAPPAATPEEDKELVREIGRKLFNDRMSFGPPQ